MPRKERKRARGLCEREPGSDIWCRRLSADGMMKREKMGRWGDAVDLLRKRKNNVHVGIHMPENMRQASVRFKTFCDDKLVCRKQHNRDFHYVEIRIDKLAAEFGAPLRGSITHADFALISTISGRSNQTRRSSKQLLFGHNQEWRIEKL
jgi:hypothetical protein